MRLCNYSSENELCGVEPVQAGVELEDGILPLAIMLRNPIALRLQGGVPLPLGFRIGDTNNINELPLWLEELKDPDPNRMEIVPALNPHKVIFHPPVAHPGCVRVFSSFEEPAKTTSAKLGKSLSQTRNDSPAYHYANPGGLLGHGAALAIPDFGRQLDLEPQIAAIIGHGGRDIPVEEADAYIAGFCILNDWCLRDLEEKDYAAGCRSAKCRDFATSLGPYLVTPDELVERVDGKGFDLEMIARINGKEIWRGNWKNANHSFAEMVSYASRGVSLQPGDIFSGGPAGGSLAALGTTGDQDWLQAGDSVEIEVERLGTLMNTLV